VVIENSGEGTDTIRTTKSSYSLTNLPYVENLTDTGTSAAKLTGNSADNRIDAGPGSDTIDGKAGADTMAGGAGNDTYFVDDSADLIVEAAGSGSDTVKASATFTLGSNVEKLTLTGIAAIDGTGNELTNTIIGNAAANSLYGLAGSDTLVGSDGDDYLYGGDGPDMLRGGAGADVLTGGLGNDKFDWDAVADAGLGATRDQVLDFARGSDKLDLSTIDAKSGSGSNDSFTFIGAADFSAAAGQLRSELIHGSGGDYTLVQADVNGDGIADFEIALVGYTATLLSNDFVL
jgi:Ca2+-binding RTX toxin-like protein